VAAAAGLTVLSLGPLLVMTPDLDGARAFYGEVLCLSLSAAFDNQLVFALPGGALHVFRCENGAPPAQHGRDGASVITFEVTSVAEAMATLQARGVRFLHRRPATNADVGWSYAAFEAPGGLTHELVERG
jgi:catechol 2,3-dioxygenase-like lactoylglutathione lyase family enzyme